MNIIRYKWPVIIAAGLHGALFVSFPSPRVPFTPPAVADKAPLKPMPVEVDLRVPEESEPAGEAAGGADPLPRSPEPLVPPVIDNPFEVVVTERAVPDKSIVDLKNHRVDGPVGPGNTMQFGAPPITLAAHLDRVPRAMAQPAPDYPHALRQDGVGGSVLVEFIVGTDGNVISADATRWSRRELVEPAVRAVLRWRFEPGTLHGRKVRFRMAVPIEFNAAG